MNEKQLDWRPGTSGKMDRVEKILAVFLSRSLYADRNISALNRFFHPELVAKLSIGQCNADHKEHFQCSFDKLLRVALLNSDGSDTACEFGPKSRDRKRDHERSKSGLSSPIATHQS